MFAKHKDTKLCLLNVSYHDPAVELPEIPQWSVEPPVTPSVPCPTIAEPSLQTQSADIEILANPNPSNEHVGVDDECLYIDLGPQHPVPPISEPSTNQREGDNSESEQSYESDSDDDSLSDVQVEDLDDIVIDREPAQVVVKPEADYDKDDPPMAVGTLYSNMDAFKLALASHATKHEFQYNIEASDKSRYRVYCSGKTVGCRWRIHASTLLDRVTVKV
jgi:hypothetical protein